MSTVAINPVPRWKYELKHIDVRPGTDVFEECGLTSVSLDAANRRDIRCLVSNNAADLVG
jgi:hypothetical protein